MGTAGLVCVVKDGSVKLSQRIGFDSEPSGQGMSLMRFLKYDMKRKAFEKAIDNLNAVDSEFVESLRNSYSQPKMDPKRPVVSPFELANPELTDSMPISWLFEKIQDTEGKMNVYLDSEFYESKECQWYYGVDLDANSLTIYNKRPPAMPFIYDLSNLPKLEDLSAIG